MDTTPISHNNFINIGDSDPKLTNFSSYEANIRQFEDKYQNTEISEKLIIRNDYNLQNYKGLSAPTINIKTNLKTLSREKSKNRKNEI